MKKFLKISGIVIAAYIVTWLTVVSLAALFQSGGDPLLFGDLELSTHSLSKTCYANTYHWPVKTDYVELDIPDTVDGYRVTKLGGQNSFVGPTSPFMISMPLAKNNLGTNILPEDAQVERYHMVINIGKNLKEIKYLVMREYFDMGENQFVQILVTVNCDEENRHFYSKDGKLYNRSDDSLVGGFFYYSDYCN